MAWKKEYAENRRKKYNSDPRERERRKKQSRSGEENIKYMKKYYKNNSDKFKKTRKQQDIHNEARRERYKNDPEFREKCKSYARGRCKLKRREERLMSKYGISLKEYDEMLKQQNGKCKICGSEKVGGNHKYLKVDHCHKTGKVRGLLCNDCNLGIGKLKDDPDILRNAAKYIEEAKKQIKSKQEVLF